MLHCWLAFISIWYFGSKCIAILESDRSNVLHFQQYCAILQSVTVFPSAQYCKEYLLESNAALRTTSILYNTLQLTVDCILESNARSGTTLHAQCATKFNQVKLISTPLSSVTIVT